MKTTRFLAVTAYKAPPTQHHEPAIWECILGAVYARNSKGDTRYFDYDYDAARAWAGVWEPGVDLRVARARENGAVDEPRRGQLALWIRRPVQSTRTCGTL